MISKGSTTQKSEKFHDWGWYKGQQEWLQKTHKLLDLLGNQSPHHALLRLKGIFRELEDKTQALQKLTELTSSDNYGNALKKVEFLVKDMSEEECLHILPEVFHHPPKKWLDGEPRNEREKKPAWKLSLRQAQQQWRYNLRLLADTWKCTELIDSADRELTRRSFIDAYLSMEPQEFFKECYGFLHNLPWDEETQEFKSNEPDEPSISEVSESLKLTTPYTYEKQQRNSRE